MNETAFPVPSVLNSNGDPIVGTRGMSLRDYFAAKAMQSYINRSGNVISIGQDSEQIWLDVIAESAYRMADAMLKEREK